MQAPHFSMHRIPPPPPAAIFDGGYSPAAAAFQSGMLHPGSLSASQQQQISAEDSTSDQYGAAVVPSYKWDVGPSALLRGAVSADAESYNPLRTAVSAPYAHGAGAQGYAQQYSPPFRGFSNSRLGAVAAVASQPYQQSQAPPRSRSGGRAPSTAVSAEVDALLNAHKRLEAAALGNNGSSRSGLSSLESSSGVDPRAMSTSSSGQMRPNSYSSSTSLPQPTSGSSLNAPKPPRAVTLSAVDALSRARFALSSSGSAANSRPGSSKASTEESAAAQHPSRKHASGEEDLDFEALESDFVDFSGPPA